MLRSSVLLALLIGCQPDDATDTSSTSGVIDLSCQSVTATDWSESSHAKGADQAYDIVFDDGNVARVDIVMCPEHYEIMRTDLDDLYGTDDVGGGGPGGGGPGGGGGGAAAESDTNPIYVPVQVAYDGKSWPMVGMRYKGNSSLRTAYQRGIDKLPFRLNFDRYEDDVPEVEDQRFYGFKELKFSSGYSDDSLIRDKLASDTFREAGVPAAKSAFVRVYVDIGDGPVFWGLYGMFEDPSNALLDDWFGTDEGNCYKPESTFQSFLEGEFEKCTNEDLDDYSDVQAFVTALNDDSGTDAEWRTALEDVFDVDSYLRHLALNNLIASWDTYGGIAHNYYLYANPENAGRLTWIPWDFNESYTTTGPRAPVSIEMNEVGQEWPLITAVRDDPTYASQYYTHLADLKSGAFDADTQTTRMATYHDLIAPFVNGEVSEEVAPYTNLTSIQAFESSLESGSDALYSRIDDAHVEAAAALDQQ